MKEETKREKWKRYFGLGEGAWGTGGKITLAAVFGILAFVVGGVALPVWLPIASMFVLGFFEAGSFLINIKDWILGLGNLKEKLKEAIWQYKLWLGIQTVVKFFTAFAPLIAAIGAATFGVAGILTAVGVLTAGTVPAIIIGVAVPTCFFAAFSLSAISIIIKLPDIIKEAKKEKQGFRAILKKLMPELVTLTVCLGSVAVVGAALLAPAIITTLGVASAALAALAPIILGVAAVAWVVMATLGAKSTVDKMLGGDQELKKFDKKLYEKIKEKREINVEKIVKKEVKKEDEKTPLLGVSVKPFFTEDKGGEQIAEKRDTKGKSHGKK